MSEYVCRECGPGLYDGELYCFVKGNIENPAKIPCLNRLKGKKPFFEVNYADDAETVDETPIVWEGDDD